MPPKRTKINQGVYSCTACDKPISSVDDAKLHPLIGCLICRKCCLTYANGDFGTLWEDGLDEYGDDNYCRWCCDGGDLFGCMKEGANGDRCHFSFCKDCITRNVSDDQILTLDDLDPEERAQIRWHCYACDPSKLASLKKEARDAIASLASNESRRRTDEVQSPSKHPKRRKTESASSNSTNRLSVADDMREKQSAPNEASSRSNHSKSQEPLATPKQAQQFQSSPPAKPVQMNSATPKASIPCDALLPSLNEPVHSRSSKSSAPTTNNAQAYRHKPLPKSSSTTPQLTPQAILKKPSDNKGPLSNQSQQPLCKPLQIVPGKQPVTSAPPNLTPLPTPSRNDFQETPKFSQLPPPKLKAAPVQPPKLKNVTIAKNNQPPTPLLTDKEIEELNKSICRSSTVNEIDLKRRLETYRKTKDSCVEEISNRFETIVELFTLAKSNSAPNTKKLINIQIDSLKKPMQEFENMLNDLSRQAIHCE